MWRARLSTVVAALVVGFLLSSALVAGRNAAQLQDARKADLLALLEARQSHNDALSAQLEELRERVSDTEETLTRQAPALSSQLQVLEAEAGLTPVRGPGLRVTFADSTSACGERPEDCRIQDADLQLAANTLFAVGAEAVAINGERLVSTTAIRSAGGSVLVNYRVLVSPYEVEAIGNPERLRQTFTASDLAADFSIWRDVYGLGFSVETVDGGEEADLLLVPAYSGSTQLRIAQMVSS